MPRLSLPIEKIQAEYEVVVIGSGYGGSIAASRLARAGRRVCVLERGREIPKGEFPRTDVEAVAEIQVDAPEGHIGSRTGLYDMRLNDDVNLMVGCGLGGTSLVNGGVALHPDPRVFDDARWPSRLRADRDALLEDGYRWAREMLQPSRYPESAPRLLKLEALRKSAEGIGAADRFHPVDINVNFEPQVNHVGIEQPGCVLCGDCVSGCNHGAKNNLLANYLPDARNHGAEIFTGAEVRRLERDGDRWVVHYQPLATGREAFAAPTLFVRAEIVILAAGTLGSTEILMRSREAGLALSGRLGDRFTGNGDVIGWAYNAEVPVNAVGFGPTPVGSVPPVGPTITGIIDLRGHADVSEDMIIEEGAVPGAIGHILLVPFTAEAALASAERGLTLRQRIAKGERTLESAFLGPRTGAIRNTQTFLVMAHDDDHGRMDLEGDRIRIHWPGAAEAKHFTLANATLKEASKAIGGIYDPDPLWASPVSRSVFTAHPLGGCAMADRAEDGVVDDRGRVFSGAAGESVHEGLFVWDGAIIPVPLGVNPLLTISALAERAVTLLARERGWTLDRSLQPARPGASAEAVGISWSERLAGFFTVGEKDDHERGHDAGEEQKSRLELVASIHADSIDAMIAKPDHPALLVGTVVAPALSAKPLVATGGTFQAFVQDPKDPHERRLVYRMRATTEEGRVYTIAGDKRLHDGPATHAWKEMTTLYTTVYDGDSVEAPVLGKGVLRIGLGDARRFLSTMRATGGPNEEARLAALLRYGRWLLGSLWETYGHLVGEHTR